MLYPYLSEQIKSYRKHRDLSQKQLGELILKSEISIRKYESGNYNIPPSVLLNISEALKIGVLTLLGNDIESYCKNNPSFTIDNNLLINNELLQTNLSWHEELLKITTTPSGLLYTILDYMREEEIFFTAMSIPKKNVPNDTDLPYFSNEQIENIIKKVCSLVIEEVERIESFNSDVYQKTIKMVDYISKSKNINFTKKELDELYEKFDVN